MDIPSNVQEITANEFESCIAENEIVVVDFWAKWCAPCKNFAKTFANIAIKYSQITFAKVDIEQQPELAEAFEIRSIPHLMVFKQGIVIYSESGSMPDSTLQELVEQALNADVSAIAAQIESDN